MACPDAVLTMKPAVAPGCSNTFIAGNGVKTVLTPVVDVPRDVTVEDAMSDQCDGLPTSAIADVPFVTCHTWTVWTPGSRLTSSPQMTTGSSVLL